MSREHFISQGAFDEQYISVQGFEWCADEPTKVSLASNASKILCGVHNNGLSPVDDEGIYALRYFQSLGHFEVKDGLNDRPISGFLFERWLLKVAINVSFGGNQEIGVGMSESEPGWPSPYLLAVVFGDMPFSHHMGAYLLCSRGARMVNPGAIAIAPIQKDGKIAGFYFHLRGIDIFLSLYPGCAVPSLGQLGEFTFEKHVLEAATVYRPRQIVIASDQNKSAEINFTWGA
nr:hypothetical protein [Oceanococcus sp. HetDA_MAG_MS8]